MTPASFTPIHSCQIPNTIEKNKKPLAILISRTLKTRYLLFSMGLPTHCVLSASITIITAAKMLRRSSQQRSSTVDDSLCPKNTKNRSCHHHPSLFHRQLCQHGQYRHDLSNHAPRRGLRPGTFLVQRASLCDLLQPRSPYQRPSR